MPLIGNNLQAVVSVVQNERPVRSQHPETLRAPTSMEGLPKEHAEKLCIPGPDFHQAQE
jgi:hypothetical protein